MKSRTLLAGPAALLLSLWCQQCVAQVDVAYGIKIGAPIGLAECPKKTFTGSMAMYVNVSFPCLQEISAKPAPGNFSEGGLITFPFDQRPAQSTWDNVGFNISNGVVVVLAVSTGGIPTQERVFSELVAKYGQPMSSAKVPLQNAMGSKYEAISAKWLVEGIEVQFNGSSGRIDNGLLLIGTPDGIRQRQARIDRVLNSGKKPL